MRRLSPGPLAAATAASLLICLAGLAAWARSIGRFDVARGTAGSTYYTLLSGNGLFQVQGETDYPYRVAWYTAHGPSSVAPDLGPRARGALGVRFQRFHTVHASGRENPTWAMTLPCWVVSLVGAFLPSIWLLRFRRRAYRAGRHLCLACGYDLRATPDRCPECGVVGGRGAEA